MDGKQLPLLVLPPSFPSCCLAVDCGGHGNVQVKGAPWEIVPI